jgi:hypothetical protein
MARPILRPRWADADNLRTRVRAAIDRAIAAITGADKTGILSAVKRSRDSSLRRAAVRRCRRRHTLLARAAADLAARFKPVSVPATAAPGTSRTESPPP